MNHVVAQYITCPSLATFTGSSCRCLRCKFASSHLPRRRNLSNSSSQQEQQQTMATVIQVPFFLNCHMDRIFVPEHTHSHLSGYSSAHTSKRRPKFGHILVRTAIINFFFLFQKKHKTSWPMVPVPSSALKLGTEPQVLGRAVFPRKTATFVASQKRRCPKK